MTGSEIRQLRNRLGWTTHEMAAYLQVGSGSINNWEHGRAQPDPFRMAALRQMRARLDQFDDEQRRDDWIAKITAIAVGGTIGVLLGILFAEKPVQPDLFEAEGADE